MTDHSLTNQKGVDHLRFMAEAEEILRSLKKIEKFFTWEERRVLEQAAEVITNLINEKMNEQNDLSKELT